MLIQKPAGIGDIVSIKLISGEEIIGRLDADTTESIRLDRPKSVTIAKDGLGMMPFMFLGGSDTFIIKHIHIIVMVMAEKSAADQYVQGTTGISLV
jgi:hypothetical protein